MELFSTVWAGPYVREDNSNVYVMVTWLIWIIIKRYYDQLMSNDLKFSFKAKHSTVMCTATLKEIASHYNAKGSQVFMCMLDATKAFDKVDFVKQFELLMRRDIPGVFLRLILDLHTYAKDLKQHGTEQFHNLFQ